MDNKAAQAMVDARDRAQQTPEEVRQAFLARRHKAAGLELRPFSLGILWLFEELQHPFIQAPQLDGEGKALETPMTAKDAARALYIFWQPEAARDALSSGIEVFDAQALEMALSIAPSDLPEVTRVVANVFAEGLATVPGAGGSNPPGTGSSGRKRTRGSAGH